MRTSILLLLIISTTISCIAQDETKHVSFEKYSSFIDEEVPSTMSVSMSPTDYQYLFNQISLKAFGVNDHGVIFGQNFNFKLAVSTIINNKRIITFSKIRFDSLYSSSGEVAIKTILAHELGHIVNNHPIRPANAAKRKLNELRADYYAGLLMRETGADFDEIIRVYQRYKALPVSYTHPTYEARVRQVAKGWIQGSLDIWNTQSELFDDLLKNNFLHQLAQNGEESRVDEFKDKYDNYIDLRNQIYLASDSIFIPTDDLLNSLAIRSNNLEIIQDPLYMAEIMFKTNELNNLSFKKLFPGIKMDKDYRDSLGSALFAIAELEELVELFGMYFRIEGTNLIEFGPSEESVGKVETLNDLRIIEIDNTKFFVGNDQNIRKSPSISSPVVGKIVTR